MKPFTMQSLIKLSRKSMVLVNRFICIAEDIIIVDEICDLLNTIVTYCNDNAITIVQCFKRRKLARLFGRGQSMSCICILKDPYTIGNDLKVLQENIRSQLTYMCLLQ